MLKPKMRRMLAAMAGFLMFCVSCAGSPGEETLPEDTVPVSVMGREDREVLSDFRNIEIGGEHDCTMLFVNAGKADAVVVQVDGRNYLIDTGTAASPPMICAALTWMNVQSLDGVFLTHSHNDHTGGFRTVTENYPVSVCYTASISEDYEKFDRLRGDIPRVSLDPGAVVEIAEGAYFEVLGPIRYHPTDDNNNSLVLRLTVNGVTTIFCGDMLHDEEKSLMNAGMDLRCDLLKLGHHGKKDATCTSFLREAMPDYAVICTDREADSSTAHKSVTKALKGMDCRVYITDEYAIGLAVTVERDGTVRFENAEPRTKNPKVRFESVSKSDQALTLINGEETDADVSEWFIVSETGKELYRIPDGTVIPAGGKLTIACMGSGTAADLTWMDGTVWHKTKEDNAVLVDRFGNIADEMPSK